MLAAVAISMIGCTGPLRAACSDPVLIQFFPDRFATVAGTDWPTSTRLCAGAVARLDGPAGAESLVAAYSNGTDAAIRVLQPNGDGFSLRAEAASDLGGGMPMVDVVDVEGDGRHEVVARFGTASHNTRTWLFRWSGSALVAIGPTDEDGDTVLVNEPGFQDIDGDGVKELFQSDGRGNSMIYTLKESGFTMLATAPFVETCFRKAGAPSPIKFEFDVEAPESRWQLWLINGDGGRARVSSAVVRINGHEVVRPSDLNQNVARLDRDAFLLGHNEISVELRGEPMSRITLIVVKAVD